MHGLFRPESLLLPLLGLVGLCTGQAPVAQPVLAAPQIVNKATPAVAMVLVAQAPDMSFQVSSSTDRDFILHNFKTMYVDATEAKYFGSLQMKAALFRNPGFAALNIRIVDDPGSADTVLVVSYTFAWDYPFELKHRKSSVLLLAGKGSGPFSGPAGAASVADQFVKALKAWRIPSTKEK